MSQPRGMRDLVHRGPAALSRRPSDGGSHRRAAAVLTSEVENRERLGSADDPGIRAAAFRADLALRAGGLRDGTPGLRTPFRLRFTHGGYLIITGFGRTRVR